MPGRWSVAGIVIGAALALPGAAAATPLPQVTGPLPVSATSYPFGAADHEGVPEDLSKVGYVEDEYLVSGKANVYDWSVSGPATVRTADAPYTTRVLIRRPAPGKHFSGNVVVEMLNPSNLYDLNIGWAMAHRQIVRNGDAWIGITAKPIDVVALKTFDPARYGSLSFANPLPLSDPRNCTDIQTVVDPPELQSRATEDGLIWDIYSQVGAWLRSGASSNPLANRVTHAYGFGYSQTGGYLVDYINAINPRVVQADGKPIYDGYIVAVAGGAFVGGVPLNQCQAAPSATDPRLKFSNVGVPVMRIMSQSDYLFGIDSRQDDSDTPANRLRHYEMAGAAHATPDELEFSAAPADIIRAGRAVPPPTCNGVPRSRFPSRIFFDAALRNLDDWVRNDIAPPHADPIQVSNGAPVLDAFGNVTGGLRSPYVDVPTSTWFGSSPGPSFCFIVGHEVPFTSARLHQLYRNHGQYVSAVARDTASLVAERFITSYDGEDIVSEAAHAAVPGP